MPKFKQDEAFPLIARLIVELSGGKNDFVEHGKLVEAILSDSLGQNLVNAARSADEAQKTMDWWASNMIQFFSKGITDDTSEYKSRFERTKRKKAWAYRPLDGQEKP